MLTNRYLRLWSCARTTRAESPRLNEISSRWFQTVAVRYSHHGPEFTGPPSPTVAVIGSGPAGFYTAQKLMRELHGTRVDMYEQLPVPFGLVRFGVAPDHPEVKNCQDTFEEVAASPDYTFIGNVNLGHDLPLPLLAKHYDAIIFAYGASKDRKLGLEGEDKPHIYSARAFVGWYNGLPEYHDLNPDLKAGETAVVVGQGNVALDVARTLLSKVEVLSKTDITDYALKTLSESKIKHVRIVGRRGPMQAAFTIKEVRELLHLEDVNFHPIPDELFPPDLSKLPRPRRRLMELMKKGSPVNEKATKSWSLDFLLAPKSLEWSATDPDRLEGVTFSKTKLEDPASPESKVTNTDETQLIPTSTLFRSIGYKAEAIPGMDQIGAEFDDRKGTVRHDGVGRVVPFGQTDADTAGSVAVYCSGWVKRGPTGVIASTMTDAFQTAEAIVEDWKRKHGSVDSSSSAPPREGWQGVFAEAQSLKLKLNPVHWDQWHKIDAVEKAEGEKRGKPREKFGRVPEMLAAAGVEAEG
ncbi:NADPH:adrenodoxin oxidoreductase, mitochondrial [Exophiala dermatitidis]